MPGRSSLAPGRPGIARDLRHGTLVVRGALLLSLLGIAGGVGAQEDLEAPVPLPVGRATVELDGATLPVEISIAPTGPLFALDPLVARLGGTLSVGPLGRSHTLTVDDIAAVFGPGTAVTTLGQEIVPLSHPPAAAAGGGLRVPLDLLERVYGPAGYGFRWDPARNALTISRRPPGEIPVSFEIVHLQGITTLVLHFPAAPRYRTRRLPGIVEVEVAGGRLRVADPPVLPAASLVRRIEVGAESVRVELAAGTEAEEYVLRQPFRLVFDVHPASQAVAPTPAEPRWPGLAPGIQTIVLDPGHGGRETGAIGPGGSAEKDLTLILAHDLKDRLEADMPVRVALTRDGDADPPLDERSAFANQRQADLFISLHLNSSPGASARGAETFFLSLEASDERAADLAAAENVEESTEGNPLAGSDDALTDLRLILWDLAQSHYLAESQRLAGIIQQELNAALELRDRGVKQAPFRVLRGAAMPAVLVELGFVSNPEEEAKLRDSAYRARLVGALARAVARYRSTLVESTPQASGGAPSR